MIACNHEWNPLTLSEFTDTLHTRVKPTAHYRDGFLSSLRVAQRGSLIADRPEARGALVLPVVCCRASLRDVGQHSELAETTRRG